MSFMKKISAGLVAGGLVFGALTLTQGVSATSAFATTGICGAIGAHYAVNSYASGSHICYKARAVLIVRDSMRNLAQVDMRVGAWVTQNGKSISLSGPSSWPGSYVVADTQAGSPT